MCLRDEDLFPARGTHEDKPSPTRITFSAIDAVLSDIEWALMVLLISGKRAQDERYVTAC